MKTPRTYSAFRQALLAALDYGSRVNVIPAQLDAAGFPQTLMSALTARPNVLHCHRNPDRTDPCDMSRSIGRVTLPGGVHVDVWPDGFHTLTTARNKVPSVLTTEHLRAALAVVEQVEQADAAARVARGGQP